MLNLKLLILLIRMLEMMGVQILPVEVHDEYDL